VTAEAAAAACAELVARTQSERRLPSISATVFRGGERLWYGAAGSARLDPATPPDSGTQYRIGSITKTFTAVLVLQLRDAGLLDLDDPVSAHVPEAAHGDATVRRLLAHLSGLQREPVGEVWESLATPSRDELLANLAESERVLPPHFRWHYSNLAYAVLGEVVARRAGGTWEEALADRLLRPLGLARTTLAPEAPFAQGYLVRPYEDRAAEEPDFVLNGVAAAAALWSTCDDLARWGAFLLEPDPAVLKPETLAEMTSVHTMADPDGWTLGWGLGLMLFRRGERLLAGHTGGMPGHVSVLAVSRKDGVGAAALCNNSAGFPARMMGPRLVETWLEHDPAPVTPWAPGEGVPDAYAGVLGRWWSEGGEWVFSWRGGRVEALPDGAPPGTAVSAFAPAGDDTLRCVAGHEEGEWLRLVRDGSGAVVKMYWATYPLTREQSTFGSTG
jgi:CubicO group peptidase (beta-lactamase class C family)